MNNYDESFDPPAPVAVIALRNIETGERTESFYVQLDTGDYCAIDAEIGVLGRDVPNEFSIIFDGKKLEWKEQV